MGPTHWLALAIWFFPFCLFWFDSVDFNFQATKKERVDYKCSICSALQWPLTYKWPKYQITQQITAFRGIHTRTILLHAIVILKWATALHPFTLRDRHSSENESTLNDNTMTSLSVINAASSSFVNKRPWRKCKPFCELSSTTQTIPLTNCFHFQFRQSKEREKKIMSIHKSWLIELIYYEFVCFFSLKLFFFSSQLKDSIYGTWTINGKITFSSHNNRMVFIIFFPFSLLKKKEEKHIGLRNLAMCSNEMIEMRVSI